MQYNNQGKLHSKRLAKQKPKTIFGSKKKLKNEENERSLIVETDKKEKEKRYVDQRK